MQSSHGFLLLYVTQQDKNSTPLAAVGEEQAQGARWPHVRVSTACAPAVKIPKEWKCPWQNEGSQSGNLPLEGQLSVRRHCSGFQGRWQGAVPAPLTDDTQGTS